MMSKQYVCTHHYLVVFLDTFLDTYVLYSFGVVLVVFALAIYLKMFLGVDYIHE